MIQTNLLKLDRVQNEAMRVIQGITKDTLIETMRFAPDLPPVQTRQKVRQVKTYFSAVENPHIPFHAALKDTMGCRLGRGKSWMGQAEDSILQVCQARELKQTKEWEKGTQRETFLPENLAKHCRERTTGKTESDIKPLSQENNKS